MEQVPLQVGVKSFPTFAAMDGTNSAILLAAATAQRHLILAQHWVQSSSVRARASTSSTRFAGSFSSHPARRSL